MKITVKTDDGNMYTGELVEEKQRVWTVKEWEDFEWTRAFWKYASENEGAEKQSWEHYIKIKHLQSWCAFCEYFHEEDESLNYVGCIKCPLYNCGFNKPRFGPCVYPYYDRRLINGNQVHDAKKIYDAIDAWMSTQTPEQPKTDPYLQPGWPCEVWDDDCGKYGHRLRWYNISINDFNARRDFKDPSCRWDNYRPVGTEWDFIGKWADYIELGIHGDIKAVSNRGKFEFLRIYTVLPKEYYGKTIQRPEWAKDK